MAVPKGKVSRARRNKRRSFVWKLEAPALFKGNQCGEYKLPTRYAATAATTRARKSSRRKPDPGFQCKGEGLPSPFCFVIPQEVTRLWRCVYSR